MHKHTKTAGWMFQNNMRSYHLGPTHVPICPSSGIQTTPLIFKLCLVKNIASKYETSVVDGPDKIQTYLPSNFPIPGPMFPSVVFKPAPAEGEGDSTVP